MNEIRHIPDTEALDQVAGVTLEERAQLVLATLGRTPADIRDAYRRLAKKHHPDKSGNPPEEFQLISEAFILLSRGEASRSPLLANDELIMKITGKQVAPLLDQQKEWEKYERWRRSHFFGVGVV